MEPCPVCHEPMKWTSSGGKHSVSCTRCGHYQITGSALAVLRGTQLSPVQVANISGWLRENRNFLINTDNIDNLYQLKTPSFRVRAEKLLLSLGRITEYAGQCLKRDKSWLSFGWCLNEDELSELLHFMLDAGRLAGQKIGGDPCYKIAPDGWEYLEQLKTINPESEQGFVAMWFDESLENIYFNVIAPAILEAGYRPHRVDQREHNNKIDDEIIAEIRRSRFVLADFTGLRGGVYYEAGFAKGLGLEVFWTCRKDDIKNLHFDIRQYNCIEWEQDKLEEFKKRITYRIESVIGKGTYTK